MTLIFEAFFEDVWGYAPYPWQSALSKRVCQEGWPTVLDLPTGSGKTAVLDIALHHLIVDGGTTAARRIILVVDRRVIVDQAGNRARHLRERIESGDTETLVHARRVLREMVGDGIPILESPILRGGMLRDDSWARFPHVPVLAASTVDQVGSRLLFRGYGVPHKSRAIHAGLMGCDTLFLLDEVHLARPFADSLRQLDEIRGHATEVPRRTGLVQLSATPGHVRPTDVPFGLTAADETRLAPILEASKPAELESIKVRARAPETMKRATLAARTAEHVRGMIQEGRRAVAVVVNRVDTARRVWAALEGDETYDRVLLTGRMRPLDQQAVLETVASRVGGERLDDADGFPLVVVSTQSIEAGADFDFDGLVTECASLDALRQRFGRLDRRGRIIERIGMNARGVILGRSDLGDEDPVYGAAMKRTWDWLRELGAHGEGDGVDFGISALQPSLDAISEESLDELRAPSRDSAVLMPVYVEQWGQTNPRPHADPDVALFLHGIPDGDRDSAADVRVVWRADVTLRELEAARRDKRRRQALSERLASVPPGSLESLSLPVWTVRRWLATESEEDVIDDLSDMEGIAVTQPEVSASVPVLDWRGARDSNVVAAHRVLPGSTIVVPSEMGGLGEHGTFDPGARGEVEDLGDVTQLLQRTRPTLRLDERVWSSLSGDVLAELRAASGDETADLRARMRSLLEETEATESGTQGSPWFGKLLDDILKDFRRVRLIEHETLSRDEDEESEGARKTWVLLGPRPSTQARIGKEAEVLGNDEDDESFLDESVELDPHCRAVARTAEDFARRLHLPGPLITTLRWAGTLHDIGKADPRFKAMLYAGDMVAAKFGPVLAKSRTPAPDAEARRRATALAAYPSGQRHEMVSLDMIERSDELRAIVENDGADWQLLLHLVASHHGWARPLAPVVMDRNVADHVEWHVDGLRLQGTTAHRRERLDSGVVRRFFSVSRRYGWHEVAYLEAILRLADHRVSEGVV